jgi:hypothetical protein
VFRNLEHLRFEVDCQPQVHEYWNDVHPTRHDLCKFTESRPFDFEVWLLKFLWVLKRTNISEFSGVVLVVALRESKGRMLVLRQKRERIDTLPACDSGERLLDNLHDLGAMQTNLTVTPVEIVLRKYVRPKSSSDNARHKEQLNKASINQGTELLLDLAQPNMSAWSEKFERFAGLDGSRLPPKSESSRRTPSISGPDYGDTSLNGHGKRPFQPLPSFSRPNDGPVRPVPSILMPGYDPDAMPLPISGSSRGPGAQGSVPGTTAATVSHV